RLKGEGLSVPQRPGTKGKVGSRLGGPVVFFQAEDGIRDQAGTRTDLDRAAAEGQEGQLQLGAAPSPIRSRAKATVLDEMARAFSAPAASVRSRAARSGRSSA